MSGGTSRSVGITLYDSGNVSGGAAIDSGIISPREIGSSNTTVFIENYSSATIRNYTIVDAVDGYEYPQSSGIIYNPGMTPNLWYGVSSLFPFRVRVAAGGVDGARVTIKTREF